MGLMRGENKKYRRNMWDGWGGGGGGWIQKVGGGGGGGGGKGERVVRGEWWMKRW